MSDWETFLSWARGMAMNADLDSEEREFKIDVARKLAKALEAARDEDDGWFARLRHELQNTNLLPWQFADALLKQAADEPTSLRTALLDLLDSEPSPGSIDSFAERIRVIHPGATPGNLVALASLVLMSRDPQSFPPYRAEPVATWADRVGVDRNDRTAGGRYFTLLDLCDGLLERVRTESSTRLAHHLRDRLDAQSVAFAVLKYPPPVQWPPLERAELMAWRRGQDMDNVTVPRGEGHRPELEAGAWAVLEPGLRGSGSVFDPNVTTWTAQSALELRRRIESAPAAAGGFMERLEAQMHGADDAVILLLAELLYLRNAPLSDMKATTKVERVNSVLSWGSGPRELPADLAGSLEGDGSFNGGMGYHAQAPGHLLWLTRFVEHWVTTSEEARAEALRDPFAFRDITASTPDDMPAIRYTLEYLSWPGVFPSVISVHQRREIRDGLIPDIGEPSGTGDSEITRDLVALQEDKRRKTRDGDKAQHWYESPWVERWRPGDEPPPRAWIVRPGEGGTALVEQWHTEGFVSLSARMLGTVDPGSPQPAVAQAVKEGYTHLDASQREATTAAYHSFLTTMHVDDIVATIDAGRLFVGVVTGEAHYVDTKGSRLRREVSWNPTATLQDDLAAPLPALLDQQGAVVEATAAYDILAELLDVAVQDDRDDEEPVKSAAVAATTPQLPAVSDEVARSLHMDREPLQEIVDLLQLRRQLVLYGPPGTGKTYVAKELAKHLVGDRSRVRLVQFHPSYSYEDFFEGFRPTLEDGQAGFKLQDGPLKSLAAEASNEENRENAYILIIDEMNRANLAKVFGELYFLLEYRSEAVRLQYQPEKVFYLPPNLFIIGTMNTTDRSIALVDAAIRRRFPFVEMHPSEEPVKSVLGRYLAANHVGDGREALLAELNKRMGDHGRDLQIGPSYLMRPEIRTDADIDRVWRYDILPLIEEHYYGQMDRAAVRAMFGVEVLRKAVAGEGSDAGAGEVSGGSGGEPGGDAEGELIG